MSRLTIVSQVTAYDDEDAVSNPVQKPVDWRRTVANLPVDNAGTEKITIEALGTKLVFDGARALLIDNTTEFELESSPIDPSRYRITHTGGTAPEFRLDRVLDLSSIQLTLTVNPNLSVTVEAASGTPFAAILEGDTVFIPGLTTGDPAGPFNTLNEGSWTVIGTSDDVLTLARDAGAVFSGVGEVVTPVAASQFQAFGPSGVQVGDTVVLSSGFATAAQRAYEIVGVNPAWIEFVSTSALGEQSDVVPTATGLVVYTSAKRYLKIESDQDCVVRLNGDTSDFNKISPWVPGDRKFPAEFSTVGRIWKLELVNKSSVPAALLVITAE